MSSSFLTEMTMFDFVSNARMRDQLRFCTEIDKLKGVLRQTWLIHENRRENDVEHSWHLGMLAMLLREYAANEHIDISRCIAMVLVHDIVEIDAGDTYIYDEAAGGDKQQREQAAAHRIFGLLPADQTRYFRELWDEFEARRSPEARYAAALDRLHPMIHNYATKGKSWLSHGVTRAQVEEKTAHIAQGAPRLWEFASALLDESVRRGYLKA
jgi:putative hydrolase of HD superfamily